MKKLLFILIAAISLTSCSERTLLGDEYFEQKYEQSYYNSYNPYKLEYQFAKQRYRLNSLKYSIESHRR